MAMYNVRGGCFTGECLVQTKTGHKPIASLTKNDQVYDPILKKFVQMICLLEMTSGKNLPVSMVEIGNLKITEYHPMMQNDVWVFPKNLNQKSILYSGKIYNLLTQGCSLVIENQIVCSLGHELQDQVVQHNYLGNKSKILHDLQAYDLAGLNAGLVVLDTDSCFTRSHKTFEIIGINKFVVV